MALVSRVGNRFGVVRCAEGPDARRRDIGDAGASLRSGNEGDSPAPPEPDGRQAVGGEYGVARRVRCHRIESLLTPCLRQPSARRAAKGLSDSRHYLCSLRTFLMQEGVAYPGLTRRPGPPQDRAL